jgi:MSHA biogenesis protein MshJ
MTASWSAWAQTLDRLSRRERAMVLAAGAALVVAFCYLAAIAPDLDRRKRVEARIADQAGQIAAAQAKQQELKRVLAQDPDAGLRDRIAAKRRELAALDIQRPELQRTLMAPDQMATFLEELVGRQRTVKLVSLRNLPVIALADGASAAGDGRTERIYRHGVEIVLEGGYRDLLGYMRRLERQPWQIYWGQVVMKTDSSPASVTLTLYTLSLERTWLVL